MAVRGGHSLASLYGVPMPPVAESVVQTSGRRLRTYTFSLQQANMFAGGESEASGELLQLDGARTTLHLSVLQAFNDCYSGSLVLPLVSHSGGFMDNLIHEWHQIFNLPDNNRGDSPEDELDFSYTNNQGDQLSLTEPVSGLGDMVFSVSRAAACNTRLGWHLRSGVKLPTGNSDKLLGSGAADWFVDMESGPRLHGKSWRSRHMVGLMIPGKTELFSNQQPAVMYGASVVRWLALPGYSLAMQVDWRSPLFDSDLTELGKINLQLTVGGRASLSRSRWIEIGFREDISPDTSPDFSVYATVQISH